MAKRKKTSKTWVERVNFTGIDTDADLIDHLEYAVYRTCKRLGWDMSRVREGDNFRKIETWLPDPKFPKTNTLSRVGVFLNADTEDQMWKIDFLPSNWSGNNSQIEKSEAEIFMNSLEECFDQTVSLWEESHDEAEEPHKPPSNVPSNAAIQRVLDTENALLQSILDGASEMVESETVDAHRERGFYIQKTYSIPIEYENRFIHELARRVPDVVILPNSIDSLSEAMGFLLNRLPKTLEVVCECVEKRSEFSFNLVCEWIERWVQHTRNAADVAQEGKAKSESAVSPRIPRQPKRLNDWKAAWRKVKGRWKGGGDYHELAKLANVSPETIADIVKAGDAGLLD